MKQIFRYYLFIFILLGITCMASAQENWMPDPNLRQAIRDELGIIEIKRDDMLRLTRLNGEDRQIKDLTGLELAINMDFLLLGFNPISDISPLSSLEQLRIFNMAVCQISDIRPLANLTRLESLHLHYNRIEDITPLANLTQLTDLWLNHNQIVDVSPLGDLKNLTDLQIGGNAIRDFSPLLGLNLTHVDVDIRMLHELASVVVKVPDLNLKHAVREALSLPSEVPLTQLLMNQLTGLEAVDSQITDLTGLEHALNLTWLHLGVNEIHDLSPLAGLNRLEGLAIYVNPLSDLSPLANLVNLKTLDLGACQISDLQPLANLRNLESLRLHYNQIEDITPLANLTNLTELWLAANQIMDIRPLENLTALEELRIQNNWVTDYSPLDTLSLTHFEYDEICELAKIPISDRIHNRSFPSVVMAWNDILNRPSFSYEDRLTHHDLFWSPEFGLRFQRTNDGIQLAGNLNEARRQRDALLEMNPNMIFILQQPMRDADPDSPFYKAVYDDDFPWIRDTAGNRVPGGGDEYTSSLIDFTHPDVQDIMVQQAIAVARCGLYDGIFLDYWREDWNVLDGYRTYEEEQRARNTIIQRIRVAVGNDFLIVVNPNRNKLTRAAPYINGLFMETVRDHDGGYTRAGLIEIESTLFWAEENLRSPQINSLEGWGVETEPPDSSTNLRWMRVFTTMGLTHSDGYVLYITGIRHPIHEHNWNVFEITHKEEHDRGIEHNHHHDHYWYDFWDTDLGQPIGAKAQRYENREGLFIREFTNGWAVYNRSGKAQEIQLPEQATGIESGLRNTLHILPDLDGEIYLKRVADTHDVNGDGTVNILDLVAVANGFGTNAPDVNGDGVVNILDLVAVANQFGR